MTVEELRQDLENLVTGFESYKKTLEDLAKPINPVVGDDHAVTDDSTVLITTDNVVDTEEDYTEDEEIDTIDPVEDFVQSIESGNPSRKDLFQRIIDDVEARLTADDKVIVDRSMVVEKSDPSTSMKLVVSDVQFEGSYWVESLDQFVALVEA